MPVSFVTSFHGFRADYLVFFWGVGQITWYFKFRGRLPGIPKMLGQITWAGQILGQITWAGQNVGADYLGRPKSRADYLGPFSPKSGADYLVGQITWSSANCWADYLGLPKCWADYLGLGQLLGRLPLPSLRSLFCPFALSALPARVTPSLPRRLSVMVQGKNKQRRSAGSAAYAMQRRDVQGMLFRHRATGCGHAKSSREDALVTFWAVLL